MFDFECPVWRCKMSSKACLLRQTFAKQEYKQAPKGVGRYRSCLRCEHAACGPLPLRKLPYRADKVAIC